MCKLCGYEVLNDTIRKDRREHRNKNLIKYIIPYNLSNAVFCITSGAGLTFVKQVDNTDS